MDRRGAKMFLSLLRGAVVVSKCQVMNNKKKSKTMHAWLAITAIICIIVSTDVLLTNYDAERDK